jgi:hypothetical protein
MMHGTSKITLTNASVREALEDYLRKHTAVTVSINVKQWSVGASAPVAYGETPKPPIDVEFEQVQNETAAKDSV